MPSSFVMCARAVKNGRFIPEPGPTRYLLVPDGADPSPDHETPKPDAWVKKLRRASVWGSDSRRGGGDRGDILVFVHGYNNDTEIVMRRHRRLGADLAGAGFKGVVMSFDWPSDDKALNYLEDRHDAKRTALQMVRDGIAVLSREQAPGCSINLHVLAHSTGALVVREAFDDADDTHLDNGAWTVSQVAFIGGDISSASLVRGNAGTESLFRHCTRLTNYSNRLDSVLKLSNAKRLGVAPRVGRVGLPADTDPKGVDVDCTAYFESLTTDPAVRPRDQVDAIGAFDHSWHIGNRVFARDLFETLRGDADRAEISTRTRDMAGRLELAPPL